MITIVLLDHPWLSPAALVLLVALGPLVGAWLAGRPRLAWALVAGSAASAALEAVQALAPAIGRSCDTNDWWCNTLGAVLGAVLAWAALRLVRRVQPDSDGPLRSIARS